MALLTSSDFKAMLTGCLTWYLNCKHKGIPLEWGTFVEFMGIPESLFRRLSHAVLENVGMFGLFDLTLLEQQQRCFCSDICALDFVPR